MGDEFHAPRVVSPMKLPIVQLLLRGPLEYSSWMLKKLRKESRIQIELSTSTCYILRAHIDE